MKTRPTRGDATLPIRDRAAMPDATAAYGQGRDAVAYRLERRRLGNGRAAGCAGQIAILAMRSTTSPNKRDCRTVNARAKVGCAGARPSRVGLPSSPVKISPASAVRQSEASAVPVRDRGVVLHIDRERAYRWRRAFHRRWR
jgi:hypothetical protein